MCSVDRRRYRDGDFNGHWTSQLAPSQCSGTLFPSRFCPLATALPPFSTPLHFSLSFPLSRFTLPFTHLSVNLSSCVSLVRFLSSSVCWPKPSISSFSFSLPFSLLPSVSAPKSNSRSICDLEGFRAEAGHYGPLSRLRHGNTENPGPILSAKKFIARSTLIGREIIGHSFSPSARSKRLLTNSRFLAYYCRIASRPLLFLSLSFRLCVKIFFSFFFLDP